MPAPTLSDPQLSPVYALLKKPTMIDFAGHLAVVFFLSGCNFRCGFCHNAELLGRRRQGLPWARLDALCHEFRRNWVTGAVVSGGEPTLHEDLPGLIHFLKGHGFAVKLDTNGSRPEVLERVLPLLDAVAMDIKCAPERYHEFVRFADSATVIRSVELLRGSGLGVEFRTTVVETVHTAAEMHRIGDWLRGAERYLLQPFLPRPDLPDESLRGRPRTPQGLLLSHAALLRDGYGINVQVRGEL
ncbi:MAG: anaerobic ribonucleoside-triphosphate reductase activating protein [Lentisphaeria bacterium]|jgi:pyruvate formate lyase activating enzyme